MPRRREVPKREILPDPKYGNVELSKFMNVIMEGGKKAIAERIIYGALQQMETKSGKDPIELFSLAINNVVATNVHEGVVGSVSNDHIVVESAQYIFNHCTGTHHNVVKLVGAVAFHTDRTDSTAP